MTDWFKNDVLFRKECSKGHKYELVVARILEGAGLDVEVPEQKIRGHIREVSEYTNELDLAVEGRRCEVKSRNLWFTSPQNFPYDSVFVDTVSGWEAKDPKPVAVLCVSQRSEKVIVLPTWTQPQWRKTRRWDRIRKIEDTFYEADISLWAPLSAFIRRLKDLSS